MYLSSAVPGKPMNVDDVLTVSQRNNGRVGVTGLLWTDGQRFLQVLEGEDEAIETVFQRIKADTRHRALFVLHDRFVTRREFGGWEMARRGPYDSMDAFDRQMRAQLATASSAVRGTFEGLIAARRAA